MKKNKVINQSKKRMKIEKKKRMITLIRVMKPRKSKKPSLKSQPLLKERVKNLSIREF